MGAIGGIAQTVKEKLTGATSPATAETDDDRRRAEKDADNSTYRAEQQHGQTFNDVGPLGGEGTGPTATTQREIDPLEGSGGGPHGRVLDPYGKTVDPQGKM